MALESLIDNLGKLIEVDTTKVDVLKQLADALNAEVGKPAKSSDNPVVAKLQELADKEGAKQSDIKDAIENLPTEFYNVMKSYFNNYEDSLKNIENHLDELKKKSGGGGGGGGGGGSPDCSCVAAMEQALNKITLSTAAVAKSLASSGGMVLNALKGIDKSISLVAKAIRRLPSGPSAPRRRSRGSDPGDSMDADLLSQAKSILGMDMDTSSSERTAELMEEISRAIEQVKLGLPGATDELADLVKKVEGGNQKFEKMWSLISKANAEMEVMLNSEALTDKQADKLAKKYAKLEDSLSEISQNERKYGRRAIGNMKKLVVELKDVVSQYNQGAASLEQVETKQKEVLKTAQKLQASYARWKLLTEAVMDGLLAKHFAGEFGKIMSGNVAAATEMNVEARRFASTAVGLGDDFKGVKNAYRDLVRLSDQLVETTHLPPEIFRKELIKQVKKGTRSLQETKDVLESAAAGAWQIGANAEAAGDEFQRWNMHIGLSANGSKSLARTMLQVAKQTGVMGDNLLHAVEAAREVAQLMRDTGLYSQQTADNVVEWMASAQKFGVDKQVREIFAASQGGLESFMNASSEVRNLLASSGQLQNVLAGNADPEAVMRGSGDAIRNAIMQAGGGAAFQRDASGKPVGLPDLKKLDKATIARLDLIMKKRFGMKLGQATRMLEAIRDQNPEEGLAEINRQLTENRSRLTKGEIEQLELQKKQLEAAKKEKDLNKQLTALGELSDRARNSNRTMDQLLGEMRTTRGQMIANINNSSVRIADKLKEVGKDFRDVTGMSQQDLARQMREAIENGNVQQFRELNEKLQRANELANSMARTNSNLNDRRDNQTNRARNQVQNGLEAVIDKIQGMPLMLFNLITIAGGIWALYRLFSKNRVTEQIRDTVSNLAGAFLHRGSGYTHDIHCEKLLQQMIAMMGKQQKKDSPPGAHPNPVKQMVKDRDMKREKIRGMRQRGELGKGFDPNEIWKAEKEKMRIQAKARLDERKMLERALAEEKAAFDKLTKPFRKMWDYTGAPTVKALSRGKDIITKKVKDYIIEPLGRRLGDAKGVVTKKVKDYIISPVANGLTHAKTKIYKTTKHLMDSSVVKATTYAIRGMKKKVQSAFHFAVHNPIVRGVRGLAGKLGGALGGAGKMAGQLGGMMGSLGGVAAGLSSTIMAIAGPIAAVVGILALAYQSSERLQNAVKPLFEAFNKIMQKLGDAIVPLAEKIMPILIENVENMMPIFDALADLFGLLGDILKPFFQMWMMINKVIFQIIAAILKPLIKILSVILLPILKVLSPILKIIGVLFTMMLKPLKLLEPLLNVVAKVLEVLLKPLELLANLIEKAATAVESLMAPLDGLINMLGGVGDAVGGAISGVTDAIGGVVGGIGDAISSAGSGIASFFGFADGGLISKAGSTVGSEPVPIIAHVGEAILNGEQQNQVANALNTFMSSNLTPTLTGLLGMTQNMSGMMGNMSGIFGGFTGMFDNFLGVGKSMLGLGGAAQQPAQPQGAVSPTTVTVDPSQLQQMKEVQKFIGDFNTMMSNMVKMGVWGNDYNAYVQMFSNYFTGIGNALQEGMIGVITDTFPTAEDMTGANEKMDLIGGLIGKVSSTLDYMSGVLEKWVGGWWWFSPIAQIGRQARMFSMFFEDIAYALKSGVIYPIKNHFPEAKELEDIQPKLDGMTDAVKRAVKFIDDLSQELSRFSEGWWWNSPIAQIGRQVDTFASYFSGIGSAVRWGIISPVMTSFPQPNEVDMATTTINALEASLGALYDALEMLSGTMGDISSVGIDFSALNDIGGIFRAGSFELQLNAKAAEEEASYGDYWEKLLGIFTGFRAPHISLSGGLLKGMKKGFGDSLEKPVGSVSKGVGKVNTGVRHMTTGIERVGDKTGELGSGLGRLGGGLEQFQNIFARHLAAQPVRPAAPAAPTPAPVAPAAPPAPSNPIADAISRTATGLSLDSLTDIMSAHVESAVSAMAPDQDNPNVAVPVMSQSDFDSQVQSRVESARPGAAMAAASDQLAEIAANTAATVEAVKEAVEVLEDIKDLFSGGGSGGADPSNTKPRTKPRGTPNYYSWQFGRFGDTSAKQHNNTGV